LLYQSILIFLKFLTKKTYPTRFKLSSPFYSFYFMSSKSSLKNESKNDSQITITSQFEEVLQAVLTSNNHLLITGRAGTGKSTLLTLIRQKITKPAVVLAPTGLSAINVSGQTIHSFFHFGPNITTQQAHELGLKRGKTKLFQKLECLIIDEISMVRADLLDNIDAFLQSAKGNNAPFGGVQTIMIGDVYQLPPVLTYQEKEAFLQRYASAYFFSATVIKSLVSDLLGGWNFIELNTVFRQSDDNFIRLLNNIRHKKDLPDTLQTINQQQIEMDETVDKDVIMLTTTNKTADLQNLQNLDAILADSSVFKATVTGDFLEREFPTNKYLELKAGARVMFVKNDKQGRWVNGTLGTIAEISQKVLVKLDSGNLVEVEEETWEKTVMKLNESKNIFEPNVVGTFTQLPIKLAWAITIHKSQGQTFDSVLLNLEGGAFSVGQTYVALSRCRSLEGLKLVRPIYAKDVQTDVAVDNFFTWLEKLKN